MVNICNTLNEGTSKDLTCERHKIGGRYVGLVRPSSACSVDTADVYA